jgi:hypothetical protein
MSKNLSGFIAPSQHADSALRAGRLSSNCDTLADEHGECVNHPFSYLRGARSLRARARRCQRDVAGLCNELEVKVRLPLRILMSVSHHAPIDLQFWPGARTGGRWRCTGYPLLG